MPLVLVAVLAVAVVVVSLYKPCGCRAFNFACS